MDRPAALLLDIDGCIVSGVDREALPEGWKPPARCAPASPCAW